MIMTELNMQRVSDPMVQFLFEFEAYFDQVYKDIDLKRTNNAWLQQVKDAMAMAWDLSSAW